MTNFGIGYFHFDVRWKRTIKLIQGVPRAVENNETGDSRGKMQQILLRDIFR